MSKMKLCLLKEMDCSSASVGLLAYYKLALHVSGSGIVGYTYVFLTCPGKVAVWLRFC